jgi:hypothetical protein
VIVRRVVVKARMRLRRNRENGDDDVVGVGLDEVS